MNYWHMQMNQPWGRGKGTIDSSEMLREMPPVIGTGEWENTQCDYFTGDDERGIKIGDLILLREGQDPIALCKIIGDCFEDSNLTNKYHHQYYRQVEVIDWYLGDRSFPMAQGTLGRLLDKKTDSWIFINNWYLNILKYMDNKKCIELLSFKKQIILSGPPGTGKTRKAHELAALMTRKLTISYIRQNIGVGLELFSIADKVKYIIEALDANGISVKTEGGKTYKPTFPEIIKAYEGQIWLTSSVKNGNDSYSAAIAKYLSEKDPDPEFVKVIQFHPAYTYEDFVRGIEVKPMGTSLKYDVTNRLLAKVADVAIQNFNDSLKKTEVLSKEVWVDNIFDEFKEKIVSEIDKSGRYELNDTAFIFDVENDAFRYTGKVWIDQNGRRMKFRDIKNLYLENVKDGKGIKRSMNVSGLAKQHTPYFLKLLEKFNDFIGDRNPPLSGAKEVPLFNYVIIIDEINRANLPSVLGELIYALEYRGREVESMYELEDGGNKLILPPNLYIVGTMNTADRSVGHIDYAIRRRFAFVELLPELEPVHPLVHDVFKKVSELFIESYDKYVVDQKVVSAKATLSSDFRPEDVWIGHSYFICKMENNNENMPDAQARPILSNKLKYEVLPILKEYIKDGILLESETEKADGKIQQVLQLLSEWK